MNTSEDALNWLKSHALPLWLEKGVDWQNGGFAESITLEGMPVEFPRRAMVQARQIYSFRIASEMGLVSKERAKRAIVGGTQSLIRDFGLASGGFVHSIGGDRRPADLKEDLYTQAFCLFGLANAYAVEPRPEFKERALELLKYLHRERRAGPLGFFEWANGEKAYQSNPHMHMFEAAVAWMEADSSPEWKKLADDVLELCLTKFRDPNTGLIGEYFDENWKHVRHEGRFVYEPGHQFEWAWLMGRYQKLTGADLTATREAIVAGGDRPGFCPRRDTVYDEIWSDYSTKSATSRFWPQGERVKVMAQMGRLNDADRSMRTLMKFFKTAIPGLWYDTMEETGELRTQPAKASSLYHIIGAIEQRALAK